MKSLLIKETCRMIFLQIACKIHLPFYHLIPSSLSYCGKNTKGNRHCLLVMIIGFVLKKKITIICIHVNRLTKKFSTRSFRLGVIEELQCCESN